MKKVCCKREYIRVQGVMFRLGEPLPIGYSYIQAPRGFLLMTLD